MTAKTMVDVLVDHQRQNASSCLCGWAKLGHSHPEHQAAALTAAGFGLVADAKAEALEEAADWLHGEGDEDREEGTIGLWLRGRAKGARNP